MGKKTLLTGATDGIGFETAARLADEGHHLLLHGRNEAKLAKVHQALQRRSDEATIETFIADLSDLEAVRVLADQIKSSHRHIDVLINNAGVFKTGNSRTIEGFDIRFIVNTVAPYLLMRELLVVMTGESRVINLSSAAQAPVDINNLLAKGSLSDDAAYAQSKLAITMWSMEMSQRLGPDGPVIIAVNPASFLGSKMVRDAYGTQGQDLSIGAEVLTSLSLDARYAQDSGRYFDNDRKRFADPHPDAQSAEKRRALIEAIESIID
ncbi:MAG: SDR family NAD(P)-dependent oxidoreductase [Pseudomonadota bacterium]